jgi:Calx-beta domain
MRKGMPVVLLIQAVEEAEDAQPRGPAQVAEQLAHRIGKPVVSSDGPGQLGFTYQLFDAVVAGTEGDVALTAPVFRINGSEGAISVSYTVKSGTATEGEDFVMSGTLRWADGETNAKRITIDYLEDTLAEGREAFRIELRNPTGGATLHSSARFQDCIIEDNEPPPPPSSKLGLAETGSEIGEGGSVDLSVVRSGSSVGPVSVDYATSSGTATAGTDFTSESGTLSWADGDTANKTITVKITNDATDESDETFKVRLFNPSAGTTFTNSALTVTIVDDDSPGGGGGSTLGLGSAAGRIDEAGGSIVLSALRNGAALGAVSVDYATSNGTATAGSDFAPVTGTLHWADGDSSNKSISISVTDDGQNESDETLTLTLSNPSGAVLGSDSTATVTITDNDPPIDGDGSSGGGGGGSSDRLFLLGLLLIGLARGRTMDRARPRQARCASGRPVNSAGSQITKP